MSAQPQTIDSLLLGVAHTLVDGSSSTFIERLLVQCGQVTKAAMAVPQGGDYDMYLSDPTATQIQTTIQNTKSQLWATMSKFASTTSPYISEHDLVHTVRPDEQYSLIKHCIGDNLETANRHVHLVTKYKSNDHNLHSHWNTNQISASFSVPVTNNMTKKMLQQMLNRTEHKSLGNAPAKPQITYNHKVDNSYRPFRPVLRHKPNALVPLNESILKGSLAAHEVQYPHPYREEILHVEYNLDQVIPTDLLPIRALQSTPCYWIDTTEDLLQLEQCLKQQTIFSIDVEHHSQHTYQGMTCLVQISTLTQDFVLDALVLREKMSILNSSFTNPRIVKVLHGCTMDVLWLQRDLGLYLVNIFDTSQAARALELPKHNLASLLDHYCNIKADKSYQLADWRQRPLNREMMVYAREDTHYLLYIYSRMKNELIDKSNVILTKIGKNVEIVYNKVLSIPIHCHGVIPASNNPSLPPVETENGKIKVPFLLASVLIQSNRIPLAVYEKQNHPVLAARKLFSKLRIGEFSTNFQSQQQFTTTNTTTSIINKNNSEIPQLVSKPVDLDDGDHMCDNDNTQTNTDHNNNNNNLLDDNTTLRLFCAIFAWRDQKARELDESPGVVLKLDNIIRILRNPPTSVLQLEQTIRPISIFLRPIIVPLFHLIQGVIQLPSDLYNLDVTKLKFTIDGLKDLQDYYTTLVNTETGLDGLPNGEAITDDDTSQSIAPKLSNTIGTPINERILGNRAMGHRKQSALASADSIETITATTPPSSTTTTTAATTTTATTKKDEKRSKRKDKQSPKDDSITAPVVATTPTTITTTTHVGDISSDNYWSDDTISQLEQFITSHYDQIRYAHPLYFLPDYIHSLIDVKWSGTGDGISDNVDEDAAKLALASGWGAGLPELPEQRDKLSRLNWHAAKRVLEFASTGYCPVDVVPTTKFGLQLFSDGTIGDGNENDEFSAPSASSWVQLDGPEHILSSLSSPQQQKQQQLNLNIGPITSTRIQQHNTIIANDVFNQLGFEQCNQLFATPLKPLAQNQIPLGGDKNITAITLLADNDHRYNNTNHHQDIDSIQTQQPPSAIINPVAGLKSWTTNNNDDISDENDSSLDVFSSLISPPRKLGSSAHNPLFTPAHARIGGKLSTAMISNPGQSLDWDGDVSTDLIKGTPYTSRASGLSRNTHTKSLSSSRLITAKDVNDGSDDDNLGNDGDCERIPDLKNKDIGATIPVQLHDIYKLSNIKRLKKGGAANGEEGEGMVDGNNHNNNNNPNNPKGEITTIGGVGVPNNPFATSRILLDQQNYRTAMHLSDTNLFVGSGFQDIAQQHQHATVSSNNNQPQPQSINKDKEHTSITPSAIIKEPSRNQSLASSSSATDAFIVSATNNPFLNSGNGLTDTQGTIYNPRGLSAIETKLDKKDKGANKNVNNNTNNNNNKRRFY